MTVEQFMLHPVINRFFHNAPFPHPLGKGLYCAYFIMPVRIELTFIFVCNKILQSASLHQSFFEVRSK